MSQTAPHQSIFKPLFSVLEISAGAVIPATQEGAADAAGGAMVVGSMVQADLMIAGDGYDAAI